MLDVNVQQTLLRLVKNIAPLEGLNETPVPGIFCYKISKSPNIMPAVYEPCLCIIVQGRKNVLLGREMQSYGEFEFLIASVDLPVIGTVVDATDERPYYVIQMNIDVKLLSELLLKMQYSIADEKVPETGLFIGKLDDQMAGSLLRLLGLFEALDDIPVLAEGLVREMHYRMLRSEYGKAITQMSLKGTPAQRISVAIQKLRRDYDQMVKIDELANLAGMSLSSFHSHFKSITNMSPLQFQKSVRLVEARSLMMSQNLDAASTAYKVGYESPSQFSREYSRMFGSPPARDIAKIKPFPLTTDA